ncbi:hypothetical protein Q5752_004930 [Cryptotrichosporon argae]
MGSDSWPDDQFADRLFEHIPLKRVHGPLPTYFPATLTGARETENPGETGNPGETEMTFVPIDQPYSVEYFPQRRIVQFWHMSETPWSERVKFRRFAHFNAVNALVYRVSLRLSAPSGITVPESLSGGDVVTAGVFLNNDWMALEPPPLQAAEILQAKDPKGTLLPIYTFDVPSDMNLTGATERPPPTKLVLTVDKYRKIFTD